METIPVYVTRGQPCRALPLDFGLTAREREVLALLCQALPDKEIARRLAICPKTAGAYIESIYRKLGVSHDHANVRCAALLKAVQYGLVDIETAH